MTIQLISAEQVADLPDGMPGFLGFERICREALADALKTAAGQNNSHAYRLSYCSSVAMAAREYGVDDEGDLNMDRFTTYWNNSSETDFEKFDIAVRSLVTKIQIQDARTRRAGTLILSSTDRTKIEHHIQALRERIDSAPTLSDAKRKVLHKKLDELLDNLRSNKIDLAKTALVVGAIIGAVTATETGIIHLSDTVVAIFKLVHEAKEYQDSLLPPPPKQITHQSVPTPKPAPVRRETFRVLDDEIPF